ncbi:hypothetical protein GCM10023187_53980 [Nibrella viscosa]|uniref:Peptidase C39 domain-containing protein n=1 Tax=Nibrella viscosa TaxID=1084524 RepID=A0ABP8L165_9BACT
MAFTVARENPVAALLTLLRLLKVRVTHNTIADTLQRHPDYPSLLALSQTLNTLKVENLAARLTADQLFEVPTPFMVHRLEEEGMFTVVRSLQNGIVEWQDVTGSWRQEPLAEFVKHWSGVVLMAEANELAGEADFARKHRRERWQSLRLPILLMGIFMVSVSGFGALPLQSATLVGLGLHLAGAVVCGLLLAFSLDQNNPMVRQLCQLGRQANCHSVLTSPGATLGGLVSLSEIGFVYFTGGWLALVLAGLTGNQTLLAGVQAVLFGLALTALPLTFVSLWYQGQVLKQWCVLCLTVLGLLWTEALTYWISDASLWTINGQVVRIMLAGLLLPTLLWVFVKRPLADALSLKLAQKDLMRFKSNPALFTALLHQQRELRGHIPTEAVVQLGRPTAPHTMTVATNPVCGPCTRLHKELNELLADTDLLNVNLVFTISDAPNDPRRVVAKTVLALPPDQRLPALDAWFANTQQDPAQWAMGFVSMNAPANVFDLVAHHQSWCAVNQIEATPTVFVDGWKMPAQYSLKEIVPLLSRLNEVINNK